MLRRSRCGVLAGVLLAQALALPAYGLQQPLIQPARVAVVRIEDSVSYLVYSYQATNPAASAGGIAEIRIDLSGGEGLIWEDPPATGRVRYIALPSSRSRVPVGPDVPARWSGLVTDQFILVDTASAMFDSDSILPGETIDRIRLRSPFLPGIRDVYSEPTLQACCSQPLPTPDTGLPCDTIVDQCFYPSAGAFAQRSVGIGPTYPPSRMNLSLLDSLRAMSCGDLAWIRTATGCAMLERHLRAAIEGDSPPNQTEALEGLRLFAAYLESIYAQDTSGEVDENAYWMLRTNARELIRVLERGPVGVSSEQALERRGVRPAASG